MDIGSIILTIVCIIGGVVVLVVLLWATVAIVGLSLARKAAKDVQSNFHNFNQPNGRRR